MSAGAIRSVTVGVSSIDTALRLFRDALGLQVDSDAEAGADLAAAWGLPAGTRIRLTELSCGGYPTGRLRLAEYDPPATGVVRADLPGEPDAAAAIGPKAIDFYSRAPVAEAAAELTAAGYPPRSDPISYRVGEIETTELLFTGPDGLPFLVMLGSPNRRETGPACAFSEIATVSVICGDPEASLRFYRDGLGLAVAIDSEIDAELRDLVARLTGVEQGTRTHLRSFREPGEPSGKYLLVHFFEASTTRLVDRMRPGRLGISLFTHEVDNLEGAVARLAGAGGRVVDRFHTLDSGRRLALVRGPNEELLELVAPT